MRLKYRLLLAMATIVVGVLSWAGLLVSREFSKQVMEETSRELRGARDVFEAFHQVRYRLLLADCRIVAQSPMLRAVVSTPDVAKETIENTAAEMHKIVGSALFLMVNSQGTVVAAVDRPSLVGRPIKDALVTQALSGGYSTGFWSEQGRLFQVVAAPLRYDSDIHGALVLGFLVDGRVAGELARMTASQVAFFVGGTMIAHSGGGAKTADQVSLPPNRALLETVAGAWSAGKTPSAPLELFLGGEPHLALGSALPGMVSGQRAHVVFLRSTERAQAIARQLRQHLLGVGALALLVALFLSLWGARAVVVPIADLVETTRAIASGDLSRRVTVASNDEVGELAASFDEMVGKLEASTAEILAAKDYIDNVLRSMSDSLLVVEPDGSIRTANQATVDLLGVTRESLIGLPFTAVLADGGKALGGERTFDELERGIQNRELAYKTSAGESIPVTFSASPMRDPFGKPIGAVVVARDLRQILKLQQELAHREKLASLGQLAAGLAHEIRNPLAVIRFATNYLQKHTQSAATARPERVVQSFEDIGHEVQRMGDLIDELLMFSKKPAPEVGGVELPPLLVELEEQLRKRDEIAGITLEMQVQAGLPTLQVAREPLRRILLNLTINALQAMNGAGKLTVRAWKEVRGGVEGAAVAVVDTGPGIPPENRAKIFDPFFTTKRSGTGLGLFICSQTIHGMGGTIDLESEVGRGTTFTLWMRPRGEGGV
jgi:PAS domain S-box-containing protein